MRIYSRVFRDGEPIPEEFAFKLNGGQTTPPLSFEGVPEETKSLAIVMEDPDIKTGGTFKHWLIYNLPSEAKGVARGIPEEAEMLKMKGVVVHQGKNSLDDIGYLGMNPPKGEKHSYFFTLYALSERIEESGLNVRRFRKLVKGKVLAQAKTFGTFTWNNRQ